MAEHIGVFTKLISKITGGRITLQSILTYDQVRSLAALNGTDLVDKNMLTGAVPTPPQTVNFTTANFPFIITTFSVTYGQFGASPTIILRENYADLTTGHSSWRQRFEWVYDTVTDELTIDAPPFNGDITFKV